jgi:Fe-S-cluster containining protein
MNSPCATCAAHCCVGRAVALAAADVSRLQATLGLAWSSFAAVISDADGFLLAAAGPRYGFRLRHGGDGSCVFAVDLVTTRRCGVHAVRPLSCRVYPWHVALAADDDAAPLVALGNDAACPPPLAAAWRARLDDERADLAAIVAESARESEARARWNDAVARSGRRHVIEDYLAWMARAQ